MRHDIRVLEELGAEFERVAFNPRRHRFARPRWRTLGRWRPLALIFVLVLAGATAALAAGVFKLGSPFGANAPQTPNAGAGAETRAGAHVLAISVADPQGGPPWGLRIERTTRRLICITPGRLDYGKIGVLGIDHAFNDDGRFHPLAINANEPPNPECATVDARGNAFLSVTAQGVPASGLNTICHGVAASLFASLTSGASDWRRVAEHRPGPVCAPSQLRNLYFGLLGPDAVSITYPGRDGQLATEKTVGSDGGYLVLGPPSEATCNPAGTCGDLAPTPALSPGFVESVTYRNGVVCRSAQLGKREAARVAQLLAAERKRFPDLGPTATRAAIEAETRWFQPRYQAIVNAAACPLLGYVAPQTGRVTSAQVRTPISVRVGKTTTWCGEVHGRHICDLPQVKLVISFTAMVAVTNFDSHYDIDTTFTPTGRCPAQALGGGGRPTTYDLHAGQRITTSESWIACPGTIHIHVGYTQDHAPSGYLIAPQSRGLPQGVLVGNVNIPID